MALDHYVSQVHLRKFYAPALDCRKMFATRKRDLRSFPCGSEDVCRIEDGNTNPFLAEPRAVEEFLKLVEPRYPQACEAMERGRPSPDDIFALAGFVSFILTCSPTAARIHEAPLVEQVRLETAILDKHDQLPAAPPELGGKKVSTLISEGAVNLSIDPKFPQAIGIGTILDLTMSFGNFSWEVLINEHDDSPFFTSDFPVAVERSVDPAIVPRVLALTPRVAVRIHPRTDLPNTGLSWTFPNFRIRRRRASRSDVRAVNQSVVRSAESLVFHSADPPWVRQFVKRNARFRVESEITTIPSGTGYFSLTRTVLRESADSVWT